MSVPDSPECGPDQFEPRWVRETLRGVRLGDRGDAARQRGDRERSRVLGEIFGDYVVRRRDRPAPVEEVPQVGAVGAAGVIGYGGVNVGLDERIKGKFKSILDY